MTWVITRLCRDCLDTSCVEVCPVDCIYQYVGPASDKFPNQLYIDFGDHRPFGVITGLACVADAWR